MVVLIRSASQNVSVLLRFGNFWKKYCVIMIFNKKKYIEEKIDL